MPGTNMHAPGSRSPGEHMSLKKKVMAKKPTHGGAAQALTSQSGVGRRTLPPKPKNSTSLLRHHKPKKPDVGPQKKPVADLILAAVGTAFSVQPSVNTATSASLESLWTLDEEDTTTCKYNHYQAATAQSLLLKNQDPFLPPIKSPPSVSDLWSFEGVTNSAQPEWDTEDPFQCINPYEAEGIKQDPFEKSKLSECSKVPIAEGIKQDPFKKSKLNECSKVPIAEEGIDALEKSQKDKQDTYQDIEETSYTPVKEDIAPEGAKEAPASLFLTEIKSEPEPRHNSEQPEPIEVVEASTLLEEEVLKAEFIYSEVESTQTEFCPEGSPEEMDSLEIFAVCDDNVAVEDFGLMLENMNGIKPDEQFMQQAELELRTMTASAAQHQASPVSTLNCDDIKVDQINDMVDPEILHILNQQEAVQPAQPELPVWPASGGGILILTPPPVEEQPQEQPSQAKPDILGDLVDQLINAPGEEEMEVQVSAPELPQPRSRRVRATPSHSRSLTPAPASLPLLSAPRAQRLSLKDPNARYDRMRTLNNKASQRCRENRKVKFQVMLDELREQEARNEELKLKYKLLVEAKDQAKNMFLQMITKGARQ